MFRSAYWLVRTSAHQWFPLDGNIWSSAQVLLCLTKKRFTDNEEPTTAPLKALGHGENKG